MARSQAANLTGLLSNIGGTLGKMGEPGQQYVDTFRRLQAPDIDTDDSKSIMNYAEWARRNGYDDEAKQYLALGYQQKQKETALAKEARLKEGQAANMYNRQRISDITNNPKLSTDEKRQMISDAMAAQRAVAKATGGNPTQWDSGTSALATIGKEESDLAYNTKVNNLQTVIAEAERKTDTATEQDKPAFESSLEQLYERLNAVSAEKGTRLGDTMKSARRTRAREDSADIRAEKKDDRADRADTRAQITLDYSVAASEAELEEARAIAYGEKRAAELIANGQYALTEEDRKIMPATSIFEAERLLETARKNAAAVEEATTTGTVQPSVLEQARILAESDNSIAIMLKNYETTKAQSVHGDASKNSAKLLTDAVIERNKATSGAGRDVRMRGAVAARMQALLDEGSFSQFLDGYDDYAEVMRNGEDFTQMRNAVATLAKEQNLTTDELTPDKIFELMDTAAPSLESKNWREANDRLSRMRRKALVGWKRTLASDGKTYRENVVAEYSGKTQWGDAELDRLAGRHYESAIDFYNNLLMLPINRQEIFLARQLYANETPIFKPKEIGNSGSYMPPLLKEEQVMKMYDSVRSGERITINSFIAE